jgi:hypothetical protein
MEEETLQTNTQNDLVRRYRESTNDRERNKIYKEIRKFYLPWVYSKLDKFNKRDQEEFVANYDFYLLRAIELWKGDSLFTSYWFKGFLIKSYHQTVRQFVEKDKRYCQLFEEEDEDIGYD